MEDAGYLGLNLFYVGAVLFVNGIWLLGHIQDKEVAIINLFVGGLGVFIALSNASRADPANLSAFTLSAYLLLFAFTYLWVGFNRYIGSDGRGLGWFCLFVSLTAVPIAFTKLLALSGGIGSLWLGLNWIAWAVLWFLYFLFLSLKKPIGKFVGWVTLIEAIVTAWVPGFLLLNVKGFA